MSPTAFLLLLLLQAPAPAPQGPVLPPQPSGVQRIEPELLRAEARYRAAIEINPDVAAFHESLALVLERQGRVDEALASHRDAVRLDSLSVRNRAGYGALLLRSGRADLAVRELEAAARLDPASPEIRAELARALARAGRTPTVDTAAAGAATAMTQPGTGTTSPEPSGGQPRTPEYHDYSGFEDDDIPHWTVARVLEVVFGVVLTVSALILLAPIIGIVVALVTGLPGLLLRRGTS